MQHDGLSTSMGGLWRNLDAMATTDPAGGFRTAEYTRSALNRRIHLVGYRKRYFVMQLGLRLLNSYIWRVSEYSMAFVCSMVSARSLHTPSRAYFRLYSRGARIDRSQCGGSHLTSLEARKMKVGIFDFFHCFNSKQGSSTSNSCSHDVSWTI